MGRGNIRVLLAERNPLLRHPLVQRLRHLSNRVRIVRAAFRSFRGHIRTQSAADPQGRCLSQLEISQGLLTALPHPAVMSPYLENLLASYPWCDTVDLRFYLIGFALGRLHASGKQKDSETNNAERKNCVPQPGAPLIPGFRMSGIHQASRPSN